MKINVQQYLPPEARQQFYKQKKAPMVRSGREEIVQPEHSTFAQVLKKLFR